MDEPRTEPLVVLQLIKGLGPGGAERLVVNQCLVSSADDIVYRAAYLLPWKDHLVEELASAGVTVRCLHGRSRSGLLWLARLRSWMRAERVDVIHAHSPLPAAATRMLLRTIRSSERPRLIYTEHNRWPRHGRITRWLNRATVRLDDDDVAVSDDVVASMPPAIARRFNVVTHGIDLDSVSAQRRHRDAVRTELGIAPEDIVVGTVANLRREKAYDTLIDAARHATQRDERLRFVAVGQGPLLDEVTDRLERSGLGDRFALLGYRADAVRVMTAFDIFTLSSRHEGLPVAAMDAQALGLPIAATSAGGLPSMVEEGVNGVLVPVDDAAALGAAYLRLTDASLRRQLGRGALRAAPRYDARRATAELEGRYRRLVASNDS